MTLQTPPNYLFFVEDVVSEVVWNKTIKKMRVSIFNVIFKLFNTFKVILCVNCMIIVNKENKPDGAGKFEI